jgi:hypothetical protein
MYRTKKADAQLKLRKLQTVNVKCVYVYPCLNNYEISFDFVVACYSLEFLIATRNYGYLKL